MYFGWAALEEADEKDEGAAGCGGGPWKCVANVGYSPTFAGQENAEKIVEGHLIGYTGVASLVRCLLLVVWVFPVSMLILLLGS